jgi:hypothetical protein
MGAYTLSSVLLIRKNVPLKYRCDMLRVLWLRGSSRLCCLPGPPTCTHRHDMDAALGGQLEFQFFHAWFNGLFLASALVTLACLYWQHQNSALLDPLLPVTNPALKPRLK